MSRTATEPTPSFVDRCHPGPLIARSPTPGVLLIWALVEYGDNTAVDGPQYSTSTLDRLDQIRYVHNCKTHRQVMTDMSQ